MVMFMKVLEKEKPWLSNGGTVAILPNTDTKVISLGIKHESCSQSSLKQAKP